MVVILLAGLMKMVILLLAVMIKMVIWWWWGNWWSWCWWYWWWGCCWQWWEWWWWCVAVLIMTIIVVMVLMARSVMKLMLIQFFSPNIFLFLVEKNQELSRDRKNICNSALWYGDETATNRSGDRGAVQSNDIINYCYLFIHNSY